MYYWRFACSSLTRFSVITNATANQFNFLLIKYENRTPILFELPMDKTRKRDVYIDKKRYAINLKKIKSN